MESHRREQKEAVPEFEGEALQKFEELSSDENFRAFCVEFFNNPLLLMVRPKDELFDLAKLIVAAKESGNLPNYYYGLKTFSFLIQDNSRKKDVEFYINLFTGGGPPWVDRESQAKRKFARPDLDVENHLLTAYFSKPTESTRKTITHLKYPTGYDADDNAVQFRKKCIEWFDEIGHDANTAKLLKLKTDMDTYLAFIEGKEALDSKFDPDDRVSIIAACDKSFVKLQKYLKDPKYASAIISMIGKPLEKLSFEEEKVSLIPPPLRKDHFNIVRAEDVVKLVLSRDRDFFKKDASHPIKLLLSSCVPANIVKAIHEIDTINKDMGCHAHFKSGYVFHSPKAGGGNESGKFGGRYLSIATGEMYLFKKDTGTHLVTRAKIENSHKDISEVIASQLTNKMFNPDAKFPDTLAPDMVVAKHKEQKEPYIGSRYFKNFNGMYIDIYKNYFQVNNVEKLIKDLNSNPDYKAVMDDFQKRTPLVGKSDRAQKFNELFDKLKAAGNKQKALELCIEYMEAIDELLPKKGRTRLLGTKEKAVKYVGKLFGKDAADKLFGGTTGSILNRTYEKHKKDHSALNGLEDGLVASLFLGDFDSHTDNLGVVTEHGVNVIKRIDFGAAFEAKHFEYDDVRLFSRSWALHRPGGEPTNHINEFPEGILLSEGFANSIKESTGNFEKFLKQENALETLLENTLKPWGDGEGVKRFAQHIGLKNIDVDDPVALRTAIKQHLRSTLEHRIHTMRKLELEIRLGLHASGNKLQEDRIKEIVKTNPKFYENLRIQNKIEVRAKRLTTSPKKSALSLLDSYLKPTLEAKESKREVFDDEKEEEKREAPASVEDAKVELPFINREGRVSHVIKGLMKGNHYGDRILAEDLALNADNIREKDLDLLDEYLDKPNDKSVAEKVRELHFSFINKINGIEATSKYLNDLAKNIANEKISKDLASELSVIIAFLESKKESIYRHDHSEDFFDHIQVLNDKIKSIKIILATNITENKVENNHIGTTIETLKIRQAILTRNPDESLRDDDIRVKAWSVLKEAAKENAEEKQKTANILNLETIIPLIDDYQVICEVKDNNYKVKSKTVESTEASDARVKKILGKDSYEKLHKAMEKSPASVNNSVSKRVLFARELQRVLMDHEKNKGTRDDTITMETLLGRRGLELYHAALEEEYQSKAFRNAVVLRATESYPGPKWQKRLALWIGGPSASGKTYATEGMIKKIAKKIMPTHPTKMSENYVLSIDGAVEREVSQVRQLTLQMGLRLGYTGIDDLEKQSGNVTKVKNRIQKAVEKNKEINIARPETFAKYAFKKYIPFLNRKFKAPFTKYAKEQNTLQIYSQVVASRGQEKRFEQTVGRMGKARAFLQNGFEYLYDVVINKLKLMCESKKYKGGLRFKSGRDNSKKALSLYKSAQKERGRTYNFELIHDLMYITFDAAKGEWREWVKEDGLDIPSQRLSARAFEAWKEAQKTYLPGEPDVYKRLSAWLSDENGGKKPEYTDGLSDFYVNGRLTDLESESLLKELRTLRAEYRAVKELVPLAEHKHAVVSPYEYDNNMEKIGGLIKEIARGVPVVDLKESLNEVTGAIGHKLNEINSKLPAVKDDIDKTKLEALYQKSLIKQALKNGNFRWDLQGHKLTMVKLEGEAFKKILLDAGVPREDLDGLKDEHFKFVLQKYIGPISDKTYVSIDALSDEFADFLKGKNELDEKLVNAFLVSPARSSINSLQKEMEMHVSLVLRVIKKKAREAGIDIDTDQFDSIIEDVSNKLQSELLPIYRSAIKDSYRNGVIDIGLLNAYLDKQRKPCALMVKQLLVDRLLQEKEFNKDQLKKIFAKLNKHSFENTTATGRDYLHTDSNKTVVRIQATKNTAHSKREGADTSAHRELIRGSLNDDGSVDIAENHIEVRVPSLAVTKLKTNDAIDDVSHKFLNIVNQHFKNAKTPVVYNLLTSLYKKPFDLDKQTKSAEIILRAAHVYNSDQLGQEDEKKHEAREDKSLPFIFVQNIPVNQHGAGLGENSKVIREARLMTDIALCTTLNNLKLCDKEDYKDIDVNYRGFLGELHEGQFLSLSAQGSLIKNTIHHIKNNLIKKELEKKYENDLNVIAGLALAKIFAADLHLYPELGTFTQALSVYLESTSLAGCKSANERYQMVAGRVNVLFGLSKNKGSDFAIKLRNFANSSEPKLEDAIALSKTLDTLYNQNLQGVVAAISEEDQGATSKVERFKTGVESIRNVNTNRAESAELSFLHQESAGDIQAHRGNHAKNLQDILEKTDEHKNEVSRPLDLKPIKEFVQRERGKLVQSEFELKDISTGIKRYQVKAKNLPIEIGLDENKLPNKDTIKYVKDEILAMLNQDWKNSHNVVIKVKSSNLAMMRAYVLICKANQIQYKLENRLRYDYKPDNATLKKFIKDNDVVFIKPEKTSALGFFRHTSEIEKIVNRLENQVDKLQKDSKHIDAETIYKLNNSYESLIAIQNKNRIDESMLKRIEKVCDGIKTLSTDFDKDKEPHHPVID